MTQETVTGTGSSYFSPNKNMFVNQASSVAEKSLKRDRVISPIFKFLGGSKKDGWLLHYVGNLYPEKGMREPNAGMAITIAKKITLSLLMGIVNKDSIFILISFLITPWKRKIKILNTVLENYVEALDLLLSDHYPHKVFYSPIARNTRKIIYLFLKNLGFSKNVYYYISIFFAIFLIYDDAYRYRVMDMFSLIDKEKLIKTPSQTVCYMFETYKKREQSSYIQELAERGETLPETQQKKWTLGVYTKIGTIHKILKYALLIPKIKHAFVQAVKFTNISEMQYTEADIYHCLVKGKYDYLGVTLSVRKKTYLKLHNGVIPPWVEMWYE